MNRPKVDPKKIESQIEALVLLFEPLTTDQREHVRRTLKGVIAGYFRACIRSEQVGDFEEHKARIYTIKAAGARLQNAMRQEPLALQILGDQQLYEQLTASLVKIKAFPTDDEVLKLLRGDVALIGRHRKTQERFRLWEPLLQLWCGVDKKVSAARQGKLRSIVEGLHKTLQIEPPGVESFYRTLRDWLGPRPGYYTAVNPIKKTWGTLPRKKRD